MDEIGFSLLISKLNGMDRRLDSLDQIVKEGNGHESLISQLATMKSQLTVLEAGSQNKTKFWENIFIAFFSTLIGILIAKIVR